jgi:hypothetical protein
MNIYFYVCRPSIEEAKGWAESFDKLMLSPGKSLSNPINFFLVNINKIKIKIFLFSWSPLFS